jgi:Leucine-rich repeat (LRR) protein
LTKLDLSANSIEEISLHLPESLEVFIANRNRLKTWPLTSTPSNLREIYLQNNVIVEMYQAEDKFDNLQVKS